ncbi:hypothetical protein [Arthrobacter sp. LFS091]|uniref:hypothetical protein n=1 Tax=Arthrobacter sp. LFS091 TaxID=3229892 RepID=UPI003A808C9B
MPQHDAAPGVVTVPASWAAVEELFGIKGEASRCWCRWFSLSGTDWKTTTPDARKEQLKTAFSAGPGPRVLAFDGISLFGAAGFSIVSRPSPGRAVMRCLAGTMTGAEVGR